MEYCILNVECWMFIGVSGGNDSNNGNNGKIMNIKVCECNKVSKIKGMNK